MDALRRGIVAGGLEGVFRLLSVEVPGVGLLELEYLLLDLNGTVAVDGDILPGVIEAVRGLASVLTPVLLTADTNGTASQTAALLACELRVIKGGRETDGKLDLVDELGADRVVAIGNGENDSYMLRDAALGIAVVGPEGAAFSAVKEADVVVTSIETALGLLCEPKRLIATLRR